MKIEYTETINCPLCGFDRNKPVFWENFSIKNETCFLGINECHSCHLCYVSPRLNSVGLSHLYNESYLEQTVSGSNHIDEKVSALEYQQFIKYLNQELRHGGAVIDLGCGIGLMIDAISKNCSNVVVHGIEYSEFAGKKAIEKGHKVSIGDITRMDDLKPNSVDAIIVLYVLEHVQDPLAILRKCHSLLRESGKIFIAVPNYRYLKLTHTGILSRLFYGKESNLFPNEHLFNYTPKTMTGILNKSGFDVTFLGQAKPLKSGGLVQRVLKIVFSGFFEVLFKCGYQLGGIHIIARKRNK